MKFYTIYWIGRDGFEQNITVPENRVDYWTQLYLSLSEVRSIYSKVYLYQED